MRADDIDRVQEIEQDVGPELAAVLADERDHGLWRWPRVVMAKSLAEWST